MKHRVRAGVFIGLVAASAAAVVAQSRRGQFAALERGDPVSPYATYYARAIGNKEARATLAAFYQFVGWGAPNKGNHGDGTQYGSSTGNGNGNGNGNGGSSGGSGSGGGAAAALPLWTYNVGAAGGYTGQIVGTNPSTSSTTTTLPVVIVPVILTITQGSQTYVLDPTAQDSNCLGVGNSAVTMLLNSPLFQNVSFSFNGVSMGSTQYLDAFVRAEWWNYVRNASSGYHLLLSPTVGTPLNIALQGSADGTGAASVNTLPTFCDGSGSHFAFVAMTSLDVAIRQYLTANNITATQFPLFITYNAAEALGSTSSGGCCVFGYHNQLPSGQTYGFSMVQGLFNGANSYIPQVPDVAAVSHELAEWIHDPFVGNMTPPWGRVGQETVGCQANFEDADPLFGTLMQVTLGGFNYHLSELAYFSWFFGAPSVAAGGGYSNNGTFRGPAKPCPPGGTN